MLTFVEFTICNKFKRRSVSFRFNLDELRGQISGQKPGQVKCSKCGLVRCF